MRRILLILLATVLLVVVPANTAFADDTASVDLHVTITVPPVPPGGNGGGGGASQEFSISAPSVSATIPSGTIVRNASGSIIPAYLARAISVTDPPSPPSDQSIIGLPYDFQPAGATFSPPITLVFNLPEGTLTTRLVLAFYDVSLGTWVELPSIIVGSTITAQVSHFTVFAVLASPLVVSPPAVVPPVVPPPPVQPKEPDAVITIPPVSPKPPDVVTPVPPVPSQPEPTPAPVIPDKVSPEPEPSGIPFWGYLLILAGVAVIGCLWWFWCRSRQASD